MSERRRAALIRLRGFEGVRFEQVQQLFGRFMRGLHELGFVVLHRLLFGQGLFIVHAEALHRLDGLRFRQTERLQHLQ